MSNDLVLWNSPNGVNIPADADVQKAITYNIQLSKREIKQIGTSYASKFYDMSSEYIWRRSINILREKVLSLGTDFVLEMLGRTDRGIVDSLPEIDVINLASELGFINKIGKMKLIQANELIQYYSSRDAEEEMDKISADGVIITCIKYIVGQTDDGLKLEYNNFRETLKSKLLNEGDNEFDMLINSPYFYRRTIVRTLLNLIKQTKGAEIQNVYSNIKTIIPAIWGSLMSEDKYSIGIAYAEAINEGNEKVSTVLKSLLLKVKGFDFVPENLRSTTFINAAKNVISVHYSLNNFYNEPSAMKSLASLGTIIPNPALGTCITAILIVKLGNKYGRSISAQRYADEMLEDMFDDKWQYYMDKVLIGEEMILYKLMENSHEINKNWCELVKEYKLYDINFDNELIKNLINSGYQNNGRNISFYAKKIYDNLNNANK